VMHETRRHRSGLLLTPIRPGGLVPIAWCVLSFTRRAATLAPKVFIITKRAPRN
jgi:hypothetical protein